MSMRTIAVQVPTQLQTKKIDKILLLALVLGLALSLYGIQWGWVECWNPDQMAFKNLFNQGKLPFNPERFDKPPFHTYFNFFLSVAPIKVIGKIFDLSPAFIRSATLIWSRFLTVFLFLGAIALVFAITKRFFGLLSARVIAIVFSTSAGFIFNSHFLTTDIPVLFWMLLAFYFAQNICLSGKTINYIGAGLFTGIATATKYNGLAVGISIVVAHALVSSPITWKRLIFSKNLVIGLAMVPIGFLVGNPFAVIDYRNFTSDFLYNYIVTPLYDGSASTNRSYGKFFWHFSEIIGFPALVVCGVAFLLAVSLTFISRSQEQRLSKQGLLLLLSVFLLYYYKFGGFPRLEVRFVLPIVPFWLMITGLFWQKLKLRLLPLIIVLATIVSYNITSSLYVGRHFAKDPRMTAQVWVKQNLPQGSSIESQQYTPKWNLLEGVKLVDVRMPIISGRKQTFEKTLNLNAWLESEIKEREQEDAAALQWYSQAALNQRHPDFIALDSIQYSRFLTGRLAAAYPAIAKYFQELIAEKYPYRIVFDQKSEPIPKLLYPQELGFVDNRIIILKRA